MSVPNIFDDDEVDDEPDEDDEDIDAGTKDGRRRYRQMRISDAKMSIIETANAICAEYDQALTLRQLYYQFIGRDLFPADWIDEAYNRKQGLDLDTKNTVKNYGRLGAIITDARYAGFLSWDVIEDRGRQPKIPSDWPSAKDRIEQAMEVFRLDRWEGQANYVELACEKDALSGVLWPICSKWHVPLIVNKGYCSASAMKEWADRLIERCGIDRDAMDAAVTPLLDTPKAERDGAWGRKVVEALEACQRRRPHVLYIGDHDPSGEDMVRDIKDRLFEFGVTTIRVDKIALTIEQVRRHRLPPNPAKVTDSRAKAYIAKFGSKSWEVDALPPRTFNELADDAIRRLVDVPKMEAVRAEEHRQREAVRKALAKAKL